METKAGNGLVMKTNLVSYSRCCHVKRMGSFFTCLWYHVQQQCNLLQKPITFRKDFYDAKTSKTTPQNLFTMRVTLSNVSFCFPFSESLPLSFLPKTNNVSWPQDCDCNMNCVSNMWWSQGGAAKCVCTCKNRSYMIFAPCMVRGIWMTDI